MIASCRGHEEIVSALLNRGAGEVEDSEGWTPLIGAARSGHVRIMLLLLEKMAQDINTHDKLENTPLLHAAFGGHVDAARLLLKHQAAVDQQNQFRWTPLVVAVHRGRMESTELFVKYNAGVHGKLLDGRSPLHLAAEGRHAELSRILLDQGATVDCADDEKRTPLMKAAYSGDQDSVRLLLEKDADVCLFDRQGRRGADIARENNRYEIASMTEAHMPKKSTQASFDRGDRQNADLLIVTREIRRNQEHFAKGGFGKVYRGKWLHADVVIKRVKTTSEDDKKTFWREARIWKEANHPRIVPFYGAYIHGANYFLVCKEAKHGNLQDYLKRKQRDGKRSMMWQMLYETASGLSFLHEHKIVHSDLKCNQILVGENGEAMLTDFGLSFISNESRPSGGVTGAIRWKAPECLRREYPSKPTTESDVYSFGMCVVKAVTGTYPWGTLPDPAIMYHLERKKFLTKPKEFTDAQWMFVKSLCDFDPLKRLTMAAAMDELKKFAREEKKDEGQEQAFIFEAQPESELENSEYTSYSIPP